MIAALALGAACASSTSSGPSAPSGESPSGTYGGGAADAGTTPAQDVGRAAGAAGATAAQTAESAGKAVADAGAEAAGAVRDTASSTAAAAGQAAQGAAEGARDTMNDGGTAAGGDAGTAARASELSDAQIAKVATTANDVDIAGGKAAARQTKNAKVREFAHEMVKDHSASNKQAALLAKKLDLTPEESDASRKLKDEGDATMRKLKGLKGAAFDRAYVESEVAFHEEVLRSLDETLIPGASDKELKSLLTKTRSVVNDHLEHARSLQSELGGK